MDLYGALVDVVETLTAAGIRATADSRDMNLPAVLVKPPTLTYRFSRSTWQGDWTAYVMGSDVGMPAAARELGALIEQVQDALGGLVTVARPADILTEDGTTVPGYELTWTTRIRT